MHLQSTVSVAGSSSLDDYVKQVVCGFEITSNTEMSNKNAQIRKTNFMFSQ